MVLVAHWKFNEEVGQEAVTAVDVAGGLSGSHSGTYSWHATFDNGYLSPGGIGDRHCYINQNDSGSVDSLGNISDLRLDDELTVMFWYYSEGVDTWHPIIDIDGVDETQAENRLFAVSRESSYELSMEWEHTAGVDVNVVSTGNIVDGTNQWYHCAVVRIANGANYDVLFYVNGVLADTQDNGGGGYVGPDGGGNALGFIGRNQASTEPTGAFRIDSLRVYNTPETVTTIADIYTTELAERETLGNIDATPTQELIEGAGMPYPSLFSGPKNPRPNSGYNL
jgi:hypothetical protein